MSKPSWMSYPATGIIKGAPVFFAYQAAFKDPKSGVMYSLVADTKSECIRLVKSLRPDLIVKEEWVTMVALMDTESVKVVGGLNPFATIGEDRGRVVEATGKPEMKTPTKVVDSDEDDLI